MKTLWLENTTDGCNGGQLLEKTMLTFEKHSLVFKKILLFKDLSEMYARIRNITHADPLFIFWISPMGEVLEVHNSHRESPPDGDKTIFNDRSHKGYLRGRVAEFGDKIYIVIYADDPESGLFARQEKLLKHSLTELLNKMEAKHPTKSEDIRKSIIIDDYSRVIRV